MHPSLIGALLMAVVTTAGDYVWFEFGVRHTAVAGILHGVILLGTLGAFLGFESRRLVTGVVGGLIAGALGAVAFYALWRVIGWGAMFAAWSLVWLGLAALDGLVLRRDTGGITWLVRGLVAAIAGGLAFYAISGVWTEHLEHPNYGWHFVAWIIAWWPGLAALTFGRKRVGAGGMR